jgi:Family of unknown function (DUF5990)/Domain of unknown function (DUF5655)
MTQLPDRPDPGQLLIAAQYADRPHLRAVLDAILAALPGIGPATVQPRVTQVSLVGPRRTFAAVQAKTRQRVDLALRLAAGGAANGVELVRTTGADEFGVRIALRRPGDVDDAVLGWLRRAYAENAAPPPKKPATPRPQEKRDRRATILIAIEASDLPGARCRPDGSGYGYDNVHVGLCSPRSLSEGDVHLPDRPWTVTGVVRGDAPRARWEFEATVRHYDDGVDVSGPFVRGRRGSRAIGLAWGELHAGGRFALFRALGLHIDDIDPSLIAAASEPGRRLVARLGLTDHKGNPRCATVRPPDVTWSVERRAG